MQPSNFDELTKALATSTSRRHALRLIVTASIGGLLGIGGISTAFGRHRHRTKSTTFSSGGTKSNKDCAKFCAQVFGPNTSAAGQCTSDAAHGRGLCVQCGSATPSSICCVRNTSGYCNGTAGACCYGGQTPCPGCPTGKTCTSTGCCDSANACGATCLTAPCDASQCRQGDPGSSACVSSWS